MHGKIWKSHTKIKKIKISDPTWNEEFKVTDGSYYVSDLQHYFGYIIKKHQTVTDHPSIMIYVNKTENRIKFRVKTGFYLDLLTPERVKLLRSTKSKITKDESGENVPHLEITEVVL